MKAKKNELKKPNNTIKKTLTTKEMIDLENSHAGFSELLSIFPNYFGINLCCVKDFTFEAEDDEYGQLKSIHINLTPTHKKQDYKDIKANGGPWPWLIKDENGNVDFREVKSEKCYDKDITEDIRKFTLEEPTIDESMEYYKKCQDKCLNPSFNKLSYRCPNTYEGVEMINTLLNKDNTSEDKHKSFYNFYKKLIDGCQQWVVEDYSQQVEKWIETDYTEIVQNWIKENTVSREECQKDSEKIATEVLSNFMDQFIPQLEGYLNTHYKRID